MEYLQVHLVEQRTHGDACIADQDVDAAETGDGGFDQSPAIRLLCDVGRAPGHCGTTTGQVVGDFGQFLFVPCPDNDIGAVGGEFVGECPSDAGRCTRDHDGFTVEKSLFGHSIWSV